MDNTETHEFWEKETLRKTVDSSMDCETNTIGTEFQRKTSEFKHQESIEQSVKQFMKQAQEIENGFGVLLEKAGKNNSSGNNTLEIS